MAKPIGIGGDQGGDGRKGLGRGGRERRAQRRRERAREERDRLDPILLKNDLGWTGFVPRTQLAQLGLNLGSRNRIRLGILSMSVTPIHLNPAVRISGFRHLRPEPTIRTIGLGN